MLARTNVVCGALEVCAQNKASQVIYATIVEKQARAAFAAVNRHDYDAFHALCVDDVRHRFGGDHALGGIRHTLAGLRLWFERLGRVMPTLVLDVEDVWVKGWPWDATIILRWTATAQPLDGGGYANHGVHIVGMRWFKVTSIDANEDSQAVAAVLKRQAACGVDEALASAIET